MSNYFDLGTYSRKTSTKSPAAQRWFDQGLVWGYGFNHEEAAKCFRRAIEEDGTFALAYWGLAYVEGCNYNKPWAAFDPADAQTAIDAAFHASRTAYELRDNTFPAERALIEAIQQRYQSPTPVDNLAKWNDDFAAAMREANRRVPDDLDVVAIYADALMNRTPWQLWNTKTGQPTPGADTIEAMEALEKGHRLPGGMLHPGLLHVYIHCMEMSGTPERALGAANALRGLVPDAGHLQHMPTHIDLLVGDYASAIASNTAAIAADNRFVAREGTVNFYTLYRCHDFHFKIYGAMFAGQFKSAIETADEMMASIPPELLNVQSPPMADWLEGFLSVKQHVLVRFGKWHEILAQPLPQDRELYCVTTAMILYAQTVANAVLGDVATAEASAARFAEAYGCVPPSRTIFNNRCVDILAVGSEMMSGEVAYRKGDYGSAFAHLRNAVQLDDALPYDEPWGWMQPARHALGALLLEQGHVEEAYVVYRADLGLDRTLPRPCQHPDNIWSLKGYHECLLRLGKIDEAKEYDAKIARLNALADVEVTASCFCRKKLDW